MLSTEVSPLARSANIRRGGHPAGMALRDAMKQGAVSGRQVKPPNLRMADASSQSCAGCKWFKGTGIGRGACRLYGGYPVRPNQVSDSFTPR